MLKQAFLAVDSGTGSIRAALFDKNIHMIDSKAICRQASGNLDADEEWNRVKKLISDVVLDNRDYEISAICTSQFLSWVPIDKSGKVLTKAMLYTDQYERELQDFMLKFPVHSFNLKTGRNPSAEMPALKLKRIKMENPGLYNRIHALITIKDYFNFKLTGRIVSDYTYAGYTMVFNINSMEYDQDILDVLGICKEKFPPLQSCSDIAGYVTEQAAGELGIAAGIPVVIGGPDGSIGILGVGGGEEHTAVSVMGTTDVLFTTSSSIGAGDGSSPLIRNVHPIPGMWLVGGPMGFSGGTINWLSESWGSNCTLEELNEQAKALPPGSDGVMFIPGLCGERTPFWNPSIRGTITGIAPGHSVGHMFRAVMEANCYTNRRILELMKLHKVNVDRIVAGGGGSRSPLWMQIKADVTKLPVSVSMETEATLRGSAVLASMAVSGSGHTPEPEIGDTFIPDETVRREYSVLYGKYMEFISIMNDFYNGSNRI